MKHSLFGKRLRAAESHTRTQPEADVDFDSCRRDGDRFVPARNEYDIRTTYNVVSPKSKGLKRKLKENRIPPDPLKDQANSLFKSVLQTELTSSPVVKKRRLLTYSAQPTMLTPRRPDIPTTSIGTYSVSPVCSDTRTLLHTPARQIRDISKRPYRILDAPDLADDFYLSLLDWSSTNIIAVGLGDGMYIWSAETQRVQVLCNLFWDYDDIASVAWIQQGSSLGIGTKNGHIRVYDASTGKLLRLYHSAHDQRIGTLSWVGDTLSSGSKDGTIQHRDIRDPNVNPFKRITGHRDEVCGLKWSGDDNRSAKLASGGNDNKVCIWDLRGSKRAAAGSSDDTPVLKFHEHKAAVKALAWNPHVHGVLATGGGQGDRRVRFWDTVKGSMIRELETKSQICNLIWSKTTNELVSTHGHSADSARNQICVWQYPSLEMVTSFTGHENRVLYVAMSPDGQSVVTGSGDKTLKFWNLFPKRQAEVKEGSPLDIAKLIR